MQKCSTLIILLFAKLNVTYKVYICIIGLVIQSTAFAQGSESVWGERAGADALQPHPEELRPCVGVLGLNCSSVN